MLAFVKSIAAAALLRFKMPVKDPLAKSEPLAEFVLVLTLERFSAYILRFSLVKAVADYLRRAVVSRTREHCPQKSTLTSGAALPLILPVKFALLISISLLPSRLPSAISTPVAPTMPSRQRIRLSLSSLLEIFSVVASVAVDFDIVLARDVLP